jgi:hypothetical protein
MKALCQYRPAVVILAALITVLLFRETAVAQGTGTILGTVHDPSGAAVAGAKIQIKNTQTGMTRTILTDTNGDYSSPVLSVGSYEVTADAKDFATVVRQGVQLTIAQQARVDFELKVSPVQQNTEVRADTSRVDTESPSLGNVETSQRIDLPAMMRMVVTTPNVFKQRRPDWLGPFNFFLFPMLSETFGGYPQGFDKSNFVFITPYESNRRKWSSLQGVNLVDGQSYQIAMQPTLNQDRVIPESFRILPNPSPQILGQAGDEIAGSGWNALHRSDSWPSAESKNYSWQARSSWQGNRSTLGAGRRSEHDRLKCLCVRKAKECCGC